MGRIDVCIEIARRPEVIFCTFGDAMRVRGRLGSLLEAKAQGADVRIVYSPLDALNIASNNPDKKVVFFSLGFETTMPSAAITLQQAKKQQVKNFFCGMSKYQLSSQHYTAYYHKDKSKLTAFLHQVMSAW